MANVNNEILYDEEIIFSHEIDIKLSTESSLIQGDDVPYVPPPVIQGVDIEDIDDIEDVEEEVRTAGKRNSSEVVGDDIQSERSTEVQRKRTKRNETATQMTETAVRTRSRTKAATRTVAGEAATNDMPMQTRSRKKVSETAKTSKRTNSKQTKSSDRPSSSRTKNMQQRAHVSSDDDSNSESDSSVYTVMERVTRNGPAMLNLRKRLEELDSQQNVTFDTDSFKCVICYDRKKDTILFPCLHQHTCGTCWIMWKIQQINRIPIEAIKNGDDVIKPKCPVCKQYVVKFMEAKN